MSLKFTRALITGKVGNLAISLIDKNRGTKWSGNKALGIDPELISHMKGIDTSRVLFITGTNGKSTVNNLINHILRYNGYKVVSNREGANLISGVATALIKGASVSGRLRSDFYVFETDERYLYNIARQLPAANLLVTNIMKDQVQRNGDPDFIYRKIARVVDTYGMKLILNGDEPRSCSLADRAKETVYYGVDRHSQAFNKNDTFVTMPCPKCHARINIDYYNNDGMGSFCCSRCGYTNNNGRKTADVKITDVDFAGKTFRINDAEFTMPYEQPFMLYDYAAAVAACKELAGLSEADCAKAFASFRNIAGRIENISYRGKNIKYLRFKQENPETFQNFINAITEDQKEKVVVIGLGTVNDIDPHYINSFYAFECDFTRLIKSSVKKFIFVTEAVAYDAANCFIYGGVDPSKIEVRPTDSVKDILDIIARADCNNIYLACELHRFEMMKEHIGKEI